MHARVELDKCRRKDVWIDQQGLAPFSIIVAKGEVWRETILEFEVSQIDEFGEVMSAGG